MSPFNIHSVEKWSFTPDSPLTSISLATNSLHVALADEKRFIYLMNSDGELLWKTQLKYEPHEIRVSTNAKYIGVLDIKNNLTVLDENGSILWEFKLDAGASSLAINQMDGFLVAGSTKGHIYFFRLDGNLIWKQKAPHTIYDLAFAPNANGFVVLSTANDLVLYDYEGMPGWIIDIGRQASGLDVSRDGKFIIVPLVEGGIHAFTLMGTYIGEYDVLENVKTASVNASGKLIYLADEQNRLILLSKNAEVIWHKKHAKEILQVYTDDTGIYCLIILAGGEMEYLQLVHEENSPTSFLEFPQEALQLEPELIWVKDFKPIMKSTRKISTLLSSGGNYIAVLGGGRISVYRDNSLLAWNDILKDPDPELYGMKAENFFFLNTQTHLARYSFREGLEWNHLMKFEKLYTPLRKGNLFAKSENTIFSIDKHGEIQWQKELNYSPDILRPDINGVSLLIEYKNRIVEIYNNSGGLSYRSQMEYSPLDINIFRGSIVDLKDPYSVVQTDIQRKTSKEFKSPLELESLYPLQNYLVLMHKSGGVTVLDENWEKQFELSESGGKYKVYYDEYRDPFYMESRDNNLSIFDKYGSKILTYKTEGEINHDSICYSGGKIIFFVGFKLYYLNLTKRKEAAKIVNFLEFEGKRSIYG